MIYKRISMYPYNGKALEEATAVPPHETASASAGRHVVIISHHISFPKANTISCVSLVRTCIKAVEGEISSRSFLVLTFLHELCTISLCTSIAELIITYPSLGGKQKMFICVYVPVCAKKFSLGQGPRNE